MPKHAKGSDTAKDAMHKIRGCILVKGSDEAKAYMKALREKRNKK